MLEPFASAARQRFSNCHIDAADTVLVAGFGPPSPYLAGANAPKVRPSLGFFTTTPAGRNSLLRSLFPCLGGHTAGCLEPALTPTTDRTIGNRDQFGIGVLLAVFSFHRITLTSA